MRPPLQHRRACHLVPILAAALLVPIAAGRAQEAPADPATMKPYTRSIPGSDVKFDMVPIPGGTFLMGSPEREPKRSQDEGPPHPVAIAPFWMGRCEVTWVEYDLFALRDDLKRKARAGVDLDHQPDSEKKADAVTRPSRPYHDPTFDLGHGVQPAICMTHHAAMEYCRWLSTKTGETYRLPTEAEWEYACRAGTKTTYSFGINPKKFDDYGWDLNNTQKPQPVGRKKPNPWGLYDMHGNVAEWCLDHYVADIYSKFPPGQPAMGPLELPTAREYPYVARGGSWDDDVDRCRSAARQSSNPKWSEQDPERPKSIWWHTDAIGVGFRVVRPLIEQENLRGFRSPVEKVKIKPAVPKAGAAQKSPLASRPPTPAPR